MSLQDRVIFNHNSALALVGDSGDYISVVKRYTDADTHGHYQYTIHNKVHRTVDSDVDLMSGAGGGSALSMLNSLLGFIGAFYEAMQSGEQGESENSGLFPDRVFHWLVEGNFVGEIESLGLMIEEEIG